MECWGGCVVAGMLQMQMIWTASLHLSSMNKILQFKSSFKPTAALWWYDKPEQWHSSRPPFPTKAALLVWVVRKMSLNNALETFCILGCKTFKLTDRRKSHQRHGITSVDRGCLSIAVCTCVLGFYWPGHSTGIWPQRQVTSWPAGTGRPVEWPHEWSL